MNCMSMLISCEYRHTDYTFSIEDIHYIMLNHAPKALKWPQAPGSGHPQAAVRLPARPPAHQARPPRGNALSAAHPRAA